MLFSTASGTPVFVSEASLAKARAHLNGPGSDEGDCQALPLSARPTNTPQQKPAGGRVVSSLFSTASGKSIDLRQDLLQMAQAKYSEDAADQGSPADPVPAPEFPAMSPGAASVSITFTTAAGTAVRVSKAALENATRKMMPDEEPSSEDDSPSQKLPQSVMASASPTPPVGGTPALGPEAKFCRPAAISANGTAGQAWPKPRTFQPPRQSAGGTRADLVNVAPKAASAPGFGPTRQKTPAPTPTTALSTDSGRPSITGTPVTSDAPRTTHYPAAGRAAPTAKLVELSFPYRRFLAEAPSRTTTTMSTTNPVAPSLPTYASIAAEAFKFQFTECGRELAAALGAPTDRPLTAAPVEAEHWRALLVSLGASPALCTVFWCRQMATSSLLQLREMAARNAASPDGAAVFSPVAAAVLLCLRYNKEIIAGDRPPLRKLVEGDIPPASLMVLSVSQICDERAAPHVRLVRLSDGFYHVKASLDIPLSTLVNDGALCPGRRLAVCGAKLLLQGQCSPEECPQQTVMSINFNCVRPVADSTPLGLVLAEPDPLPISAVHPLGSLVPAIEGVVARILPAFYLNQSGGAPGGERDPGGAAVRGPRTVRNGPAQRAYYGKLAKTLALSTERLAAEGAPPAEAKAGSRVSRVVSILLHSVDRNSDGVMEEALVQHWENCDDEEAWVRGVLASDDSMDGAGSLSVPKEGTRVIVYALTPARSQTASAPFERAKLFYSSRTLHFSAAQLRSSRGGAQAPEGSPAQDGGSQRHTYTELSSATTLTMGCAVDVLGLCTGTLSADCGLLALLLLADGAYVLLQVAVPSAARELSVPLPAPTELPAQLLIQNATFISHEDTQAGSDCARVFASEYTVATTRARHVAGHPRLFAEQYRTALLARYHATRVKCDARRDEIFRCCVEEPPPSFPAATIAGAGSTVPPHAANGGVSARTSGTVGAPNSHHHNHNHQPASGASASAEDRRVPYYLRNRSAGGPPPASAGGGLRPSGVVFPEQAPRSPPTRAIAEGGPTSTHYHFYGNVTALHAVLCSDAVREERVPLYRHNAASLDGMFRPAAAGTRPHGQLLTGIDVTWRFGAADQTRTARITDARLLDTMMDACISAEKLSSLCGDQRHPLLHRQRAAGLPTTSTREGGAWWKLLCHSVTAAKGPGAPQAMNVPSGDAMPWSESEWTTALWLLREKVKEVLFKFTVGPDGSTIRKVFHVADSCPVAAMFE